MPGGTLSGRRRASTMLKPARSCGAPCRTRTKRFARRRCTASASGATARRWSRSSHCSRAAPRRISAPPRERLARKDCPPAGRAEFETQLARFTRTVTMQDLLAARLQDAAASREERQTVLRAMAQSGLKEVPKVWLAGLASVLAGGDVELI